MPAEHRFRAGQIVVAIGVATPCRSSRTSVGLLNAVEQDGTFGPAYSNNVVVPLTDDADLVIRDLSVAIAPSAEDGCIKPCWAESHLVSATTKARLTVTQARLTPEQLAAIRRQIAPMLRADG